SRLWVKDADGNWVNLSDFLGHNWFIGFEENDHHIDSPIRQVRLSLWRNRYDLSLATLMTGSRLNLDSTGAYAPLVDLHREYYVEVAIVPEGAPIRSTDWFEFIRGRIDKANWGENGPELTLLARDQAGELQDEWIKVEREYGADDGTKLAGDVIQDLLDDNGWSSLTLWMPDG